MPTNHYRVVGDFEGHRAQRLEAAAWPLLFPSSAVHPIVTVPTRFHGRVAVLPVAAIGVRIARSQVLAICIRVELRAIAGIFDNGLRQRGSCESCRGKSGGANQCEFHLGLQYHLRSSSSHVIFLSMDRAISDHRTSRPGHIWRRGSESLTGNFEGTNRSNRWRRASVQASPQSHGGSDGAGDSGSFHDTQPIAGAQASDGGHDVAPVQ